MKNQVSFNFIFLFTILLFPIYLSAQNNPAPFIGENIARGDTLRILRLAVSTTGEFTQSVTGASDAEKVAEVITQMKAWIAEINILYGREYAVRFELVADNLLEQIIYTNVATDPWPDMTGAGCDNAGNILDIQATVIDGAIGESNYDFSHVILENFNGGCAGGFKTGYSGGFSIGITRHEMGHQFGQPHTINNGGNNNYEPENAGRSIQGGNTDPYAHSSSYHQLANFIRTTQAAAGMKISTGNNIPTIDAGLDRSIPISTPFTLSAIATDADASDVLTYVWDQLDRAIGQSLPAVDPTQGALFSRLTPTTNTSRTYPNIGDVLANNLATSTEVLPTQPRDLNFRITVNDNRKFDLNGTLVNASGTNSDDVKITVVNNGGPFQMTSQNTGDTYTGGTNQTITWDVNGTNLQPINTSNVKISLSTDGGLTFPIMLTASTDNDGSEVITLPNISTTQARLKVEAIDNYFFDINNTDIIINQDINLAGINITLTGLTTLVSENGQTDTYSVALLTTPAAGVTIGLFADAQTEISVDGVNFSMSQSITLSNTTAQVITVRGLFDMDVEGPQIGLISHVVSSSGDMTDYPIGLPGQPVNVNISDAQIPPIIGIDFDHEASTDTPTNWVKITDLRNQSFMDIPLDDGTLTTIDLTTSATNCGFGGCGFTSNGFPLPQHIQSLDPMKGVVYARGTATFSWSGLKNSTDYRVFVFGYGVFGPIDQSITITGSGPPTTFNQVAGSSNLFINDVTSSTDPLINFGKQVRSSAIGTITITATSNLGNDEMSFAGLGIQEVLGPPTNSNCAALLTLTGTNVGDNSDTNNMTLNQSSDVINSAQTIAAGVHIVYDAGSEVNLNAGFEVEATALIEAKIGGCN